MYGLKVICDVDELDVLDFAHTRKNIEMTVLVLLRIKGTHRMCRFLPSPSDLFGLIPAEFSFFKIVFEPGGSLLHDRQQSY